MTGGVGSIVTVGLALIGVLLLVVISARLARLGRWSSHPRSGRTLVLQESIALDTRRRLHLVQCGEKHVVLLTGGTQDVIVGWLTAP